MLVVPDVPAWIEYGLGQDGIMYSSAPISYPVDGDNGLTSPSISSIIPKVASPLS